ncbi:MAG: DUF3105 domain-containing protein [Chloroflexi bacterium]|nr:DUF3105 domain-containing protein [Chloroflexota bacterium]
MSRQRRRAGGGSSRRTPVPSGGGTRSIPIVPILVIAGVAVVAGLIGYLIWQQSQPAGDSFGAAARYEADLAPDKPGEHIDLQGIYDGFYGNQEGNSTAGHTTAADVDYSDQGLPPTGGPHWAGGCGRDVDSSPAICGPAPWGIFRTPWQPETLIHNMEHGGTIIWYDTTDQAIIDDLEDFVKDNRDKLLVLTPYPDMEDEYVAITVWARRDKFPVSEYSRDRLEDFMDAFYCKFDPENIC